MLQPRSIQSSLGIRDKIFSLDFILIISILTLGIIVCLRCIQLMAGNLNIIPTAIS